MIPETPVKNSSSSTESPVLLGDEDIEFTSQDLRRNLGALCVGHQTRMPLVWRNQTNKTSKQPHVVLGGGRPPYMTAKIYH